MATDVHRRSYGRSLEGLSVVAGAAHILPPDAKNHVHAAALRATYQRYVGVISPTGRSKPAEQPAESTVDQSADTPGDRTPDVPVEQRAEQSNVVTPVQLSLRVSKANSFGPKLVHGDYTYTTTRKSLLMSPQTFGGGALSASPSSASVPRGHIPAMLPHNAQHINTAAWKAYGSPSARAHHRPPLAPSNNGTGDGKTGPPGMGTAGRLPRVGGFKPTRPQSAPGGKAPRDPAEELRPAIEAMASGSFSGGSWRPPAPASSTGGPTLVDVGILAVETPDPLKAGRTDSGQLMFQQTLPTDPYSKYVWEEQARKARANMNRHLTAMASAAAVSGGFSSGSRPSSARPSSGRRSVASSNVAAAVAAAAMGGGSPAPTASGGGGGGNMPMRPRFNSTPLADVIRQGPDMRPPTVVGFAAPDMTEDATMPGPGDPRWGYTRLGRTQIERLQNSLKIIAPRVIIRPSSAPAGGGGGGGGGGGSGAPAFAVGAERSAARIVRKEASGPAFAATPPAPAAEPAEAETALESDVAARAVELEAQGSSFVGLHRTASGQVRPGSAGLARPGSAGLSRSRPPSASLARQGSASGQVVGAETSDGGLPRTGVRGSSAGRSREAAPNPRVDLRTYLAEAEAEAEEDDEDTELLMGEGVDGQQLMYEGPDGVLVPVPPEVLQSMPVAPEELAVRLAEMMAAAAVVATADQPFGPEDGDAAAAAPPVPTEEDAAAGGPVAPGGDAEAPDTSVPPTPSSTTADAQIGTDFQGLRRRIGTGPDALLALHGSSHFGRGTSRFGNILGEYGGASGGAAAAASSAEEEEPREDTVDSSAGGPLGLGSGLAGHRPGTAAARGRPTSARPMSARPMSARPGAAVPGLRGRTGGPALAEEEDEEGGGEGLQGLGRGDGPGGMDVILEQSEGQAGEDY